MKSRNVSSTQPDEAAEVPQQTYGPRNEEERIVYELVNEALQGEFKEYDTVEELLDDVLGKVDTPGK